MRTIGIWLAAVIGAWATQVAAGPPPPGYAKAADALVTAYTQADAFSGAVLVAHDGKPVLRKAYGLANREWTLPATPDTRFRLGSITKQFTAAAILQLAEQGKLTLDDPISKYYADAPAAWGPVTLKHLLTHTSGIPSYTAIPGFFGNPSRADRTPAEIVKLTQDRPLEFPPGSKFAYDNSGYILLGYVIEKVSGQTYEAYLKDHVFPRAGLANTGYDSSTAILPKRAAGYHHARGTVENAPYLAMSLPYAAGSLYSTVDDLLAWEQALQAGKVISPASVKAMFTDYGFKYGFGQSIGDQKGHRLWNHGGGINGFATMLAFYPDDGVTVVVLGNFDDAPSGRIATRLADLYFNPETGPSGPPGRAELDRYVGRYKIAGLMDIEVTREGDRLFGKATNQPKLELHRESGRTFFVSGAPAFVTFAEGDKPAQLTLRQGGVDRVAQRVD